jgi:hypothetical protein
MEDLLARIWQNLGGRIGGPLAIRLTLQPLIAAFLAIHAGMQGCAVGPTYFLTIVNSPDD